MPGLVSRPGGLVVIGILTLCSIHVNSQILSNEVSDVQYGSLGSTVTLTCGGLYRGSPVQWTHNGVSVGQRQTYISDGSLTLINATRSMEGNYSCHELSGEVLHSVKLLLGYPPAHLSLSCKVSNHFEFHCTWTQKVQTHLPSTYSSYYSVDGSKPEHCEQERPGVNECTIYNPPFWGLRCMINITEVNPLGFKSTIRFLDLHALLKPDAPEKLSWVIVEGQPTQLLVRWSLPRSWSADVEGFPLKFEVQYKPVGSNLWSKLETENTSAVIMDALVGHLHHIRVRTQDALINHSQWSEWSQEVKARPWTDPNLLNSPEVTTEPFFPDIFPSTFPVISTEKSSDSKFDDGNQDLLIILVLLAGVMLGVVSIISVLMCRIRNRRRNNMTKQELTSMVKMKSLPI